VIVNILGACLPRSKNGTRDGDPPKQNHKETIAPSHRNHYNTDPAAGVIVRRNLAFCETAWQWLMDSDSSLRYGRDDELLDFGSFFSILFQAIH
jgi:hypothetical protein